jgi:hypothetical protein
MYPIRARELFFNMPFGYRLMKYYQTGLCVYEVDDPSQRSDSQDETARLLKRVAELEGVIREVNTDQTLSAIF